MPKGDPFRKKKGEKRVSPDRKKQTGAPVFETGKMR